MYKAEKAKRFKQGILWKNHKELISSEKIVYNKKDKLLIRELLFNPMPAEFRGKYWLIISGAKQEIINNPGYYNKLKKLAKIAPNFPYKKSISLDLRRTFPSIEYFKKQENLDKLRDILQAFSLRNSISIGYCQGFNFIVAQILLVLDDEEQTFWVFTKILEDFLPLDFYLKFSGVRIDMSLAQSIISKTLVFINKNEGLTLCINNLISRCFISLYSETLEIDVLRNIWDAFFIYGDLILFRTFKFIAYLLCDKKYENPRYAIDQIHEEILNKLQKIKDTDLLNYFLMADHLINESYIKENRKRKKMKVYEQNVNFRENIAGSGKLDCDVRTPYCVYNTEINDIDKYNDFKIFRTQKNTKYYENYFADKFKNEEKKNLFQDEEEKFNVINDNNNGKNNENNNIEDAEVNLDDFNDVLLERHKHVCNKNDDNPENK
jgi:hypothetical protein